MAVAGLQNVPAFGPSFFGESRSSMSNLSSVLKMWREIESDHVVKHPHRSTRQDRTGPGSECFSTTTSVGQGSENGDDISGKSDEIENEDNNSVISEQSSDLGETERERVRQIFREWMNSGGKVHSSKKIRPGPEWLGENECGRVRIIREWVQMSTQQRNDCGSNGVTEVDSQIEQVRNGLVINRPVIDGRRPIRRLCGRQTLLDLLMRAQTERKIELQYLSERRTVSDFAHRNRIQALLRGRFLRDQRLIPDERLPLKAAIELDFLKQRQAVSDLREGFLSRLDSTASTSTNNNEDDLSFAPEINDELEPMCGEMEVTVVSTSGSEISADVSRSQQEFTAQVSEIEDQVLRNDGSKRDVSYDSGNDRNREEPVLNSEASEQVIVETSGELLKVFHENNESRSDASDVHEAPSHTTELEQNENPELNWQNMSPEVDEFQESVIEIEDSFRNWHESANDQSFEETSGDGVDQSHMAESHEQWPTNDLQEAIDSWLDMPSEEVRPSLGRIDTSYFPDDDTNQSMELRELFSRRRVSSLLGSGFRESLNQVLQSHVERLGHASGDWESDDTSSPAYAEQEQQQLNADQNSHQYHTAHRNPFATAPIHVTGPEPLWNEDLHGSSWAHNNFNQQFGTEWEVINDLRIDMARLQQRMNHMQNMLETCMEMQFELQRTVRQEVSAALNRSILSKEAVASKDTTISDESQWDQIRKGICCLCSSSNIDSLLYRCGHMCTCSKCAENLVESLGKCPMCQAPVVEVVRAYFVQ